MKKIKIGNRIVGEGEPCFIVAEAGVNHNGDIKIAKKLIDAAKEAGADAVKFQTFKAEKLVTKDTDMAEYQKENIGRMETQFDMLKKLELEEDDFFELKKYCDKKGIIFLSTPHSNEWSVDLLEKLGVEAYKIGSGDLTNIPFLEYAAKIGKPIIISTGMANMEEVKEAVETIKNTGNDKIVVLHCTTDYPCDLNDVNLRAMEKMRRELGALVGYSDHTVGITTPIAAVSLGAVLIEKHFTLDRNMEGPDHKASIEPHELKRMVEEIRKIEKVMGNWEKKPTAKEIEIIKLMRKSLVSTRKLKRGDVIRREDVVIKRPGTGIEPKYLNDVIGKRVKKDIEKDDVIKWDNIARVV